MPELLTWAAGILLTIALIADLVFIVVWAAVAVLWAVVGILWAGAELVRDAHREARRG